MVVEKAQAQLEASSTGHADYDKLTNDYFNLHDKEIPQLKQSLAQAEQNAVTLAYPSEPKLGDPVLMEDRRLPYTALAVAGIALVFSLLIIFTGSSRGPVGEVVAFGPTLPMVLPEAETIEPLSGYGLPDEEPAEPATV
jgi:hypothetical protein